MSNMTKAEKYLKKEINKFSGGLIGIGLDEDLESQIINNNNINSINFLYNNNIFNGGKYKLKSFRGKNVNIRKFKRKFKKKRTDIIVSNVNDIEEYIKSFVGISIYMCKDRIYIYGNKNKCNVPDITLKYKRYKTDIIRKEYNDDSFVLIIDARYAKNYIIKDKWYYIVDTINNAIEIISDYLLN